MAINTVEFDLSLVSPETGEYLTARAYTVPGVNNVDGTPRELSIGQLVMAICLQRATELESQIIALMETMNATSLQLENMTKIEEDILAGTVNLTTRSVTYDGRTYTYKGFLTEVMGMTGVPDSASASSTDFITALEAKMDEKNSFSQQTMIELQSLTSKRDQSYDMISNVLKSLNTVQVGIVNNY
jgi:hypothetical protein